MIRKKIIGCLLLAVATLLLIQCSSTRSQKVLRIFFDGVPGSKKVAPKSARQGSNIPHAMGSGIVNTNVTFESKFNLHKPYKEHQCDKCHDGTNMSQLIKPPTELCFTCHDKFNKKYAYVHGPVAAGYCSACHSPHLSENKNLLTRVNDKICYYCHKKKKILQNKNHQGPNTSDCTKCHNPHGGRDRYLEK